MTHETVSPSLPAAGIRHNTRWLTICGLMMAMNIGLSSFGLPVPGGHLYLNDIIIVTAALILDPAGAFLVAVSVPFWGISSFILCHVRIPCIPWSTGHGHFLYIPPLFQKQPLPVRIICLLTGALIMVVGYSLGRAYVYSTPAYAWIKLPYEILQALFGVIGGPFLVWRLHLAERIQKLLEGKY